MGSNSFTEALGIEVPLICGPMYPCSNPELVAAVSDAGGIGVVQPLSLTYVHGYEFRAGIQFIKSLTSKPIGFNALIEKSSKKYQEKMESWIEIALEEGVRFFITSLGNPKWVVEKVQPYNGIVYHDVTERKWAEKGRDAGVHGLIAVNNQAGGHAGPKSISELFDEISPLGLPVVCAGGIGTAQQFREALGIGYKGCQLGTRFIATSECTASDAYKEAIISSDEDDIVLSERITGVPVSIINTPFIQKMGLKAGPFAKWMLRGNKTKHWMRTFYGLKSIWQLKRSLKSDGFDFWQAGKSVAGINSVRPAREIVEEFSAAL